MALLASSAADDASALSLAWTADDAESLASDLGAVGCGLWCG